MLSVALIVVSTLLFSKKTFKTAEKASQKSFITGTSRVNPQEVWVHDFTNKATLVQKRLDAMEQTVEKLLKINSQSNASANSSALQPLQSDATQLRHELETLAKTEKPLFNQNILPPAPEQILPPSKDVGFKNPLKSTEVKKISISLHQSRSHQPLKSTDNTIPAGAFAKAIMLGGVDASTAIQASSDPRPILLRLTDHGTLPRRFRSDLEGCHVLAACYGDISSERVFMRLEKLSCVERKTGEVMQMNIQGYVAGEDGRAGIRGAMVDRAGPVMRNAMVGGFFSSVGKFLGQARTPLLFSPATGLAQNTPLSNTDILKQSGANGVGGALDKYADFYIKRAEQMQPVIQVAAGRIVDIVFTQGFDFSDSALRQAVSKTNDQQRFSQIQKVEEQKPLQHWLPNPEGNF